MNDLTTLAPPDLPGYMIPGWISAMQACLGEDNMVRVFREETGNQWRPGATAIDSMIDEATGANWAFVRAFTEWFNREIWGELDERDV